MVRNGKNSPILFSTGSRGGFSDPERLCDAVGCLRSLRARWHLMGSAGCDAAWLKSQSADWNRPHASELAPSSTPSLGQCSPLGSLSRPPVSFRVDPTRL